MCLYFKPHHRAETLKRQAKPKKHIYYKVVEGQRNVIGEGINCTYRYSDKYEYLASPYWVTKYKPGAGVIMSDAEETHINPQYMNGSIYNGIHVYTEKYVAKNRLRKNEIIVKVKCYNKDLIMQGHNLEAVYDRVEIEYDEYKRIMKKLIRRKK